MKKSHSTDEIANSMNSLRWTRIKSRISDVEVVASQINIGLGLNSFKNLPLIPYHIESSSLSLLHMKNVACHSTDKHRNTPSNDARNTTAINSSSVKRFVCWQTDTRLTDKYSIVIWWQHLFLWLKKPLNALWSATEFRSFVRSVPSTGFFFIILTMVWSI